MNIQRLELLSADLQAQKEFYTNFLKLPVEHTTSGLLIQAGASELLFTQAPSDFDGAYRFAFNIPRNQYTAAKKWIIDRTPILRDKNGREDFRTFQDRIRT